MGVMAENSRRSATCYGIKEKSLEVQQSHIARIVERSSRVRRLGTDIWSMENANRGDLLRHHGKTTFELLHCIIWFAITAQNTRRAMHQ